MTDLHFIRPFWLLLLVLVPILFWYLPRLQITTNNDWDKIIDPALIDALTNTQTKPIRFSLKFWRWVVVFSIVMAIIAMAGPSVHKRANSVTPHTDTVFVLLDISLSMNAHDLSPSRMHRARNIAGTILEQHTGAQLGLIAYAGDAWAVAPITNDARTLTAMLDVVDTTIAPQQGSRPDLALILATEMLSRVGGGQSQIYLFSDGFRGDKVFDIAKRMRAQGHTISVLASGTANGAKIPLQQGGYLRDFNDQQVVAKVDINKLRVLADTGGGDLITLSQSDDNLDVWLTQHKQRAKYDAAVQVNVDAAKNDAQVFTWRDDGPWILLPLLVLSSLAFRRGWLMSIAIAVVSVPLPADADWSDLWLRSDQRTAAAIKQGDYNKAMQLAPDGHWLGTISYRRGNYESAAIFFANENTADANYNRGNALFKLGRYEQALKAYNAALAFEPDHEDALFNRNLLLEFVDQQQESDRMNTQGFDDDSGEIASVNDVIDRSNGQRERNTNGQRTNSEDGEANMQSDNTVGSQSESTQRTATPEYTERQPMGDAEIDVWLQQIPDDPGGWLRRRFRMQQSRYGYREAEVGDAW